MNFQPVFACCSVALEKSSEFLFASGGFVYLLSTKGKPMGEFKLSTPRQVTGLRGELFGKDLFIVAWGKYFCEVLVITHASDFAEPRRLVQRTHIPMNGFVLSANITAAAHADREGARALLLLAPSRLVELFVARHPPCGHCTELRSWEVPFSSIAFSGLVASARDATLIAIGSCRTEVEVFWLRGADVERAQTLRGLPGAVFQLAADSSGESLSLIAAFEGRGVVQWKLRGSKFEEALRSMSADPYRVWTACTVPGGAVSGSERGGLLLHTAKGARPRPVPTFLEDIRATAYADGALLACSAAGGVELHSLGTRALDVGEVTQGVPVACMGTSKFVQVASVDPPLVLCGQPFRIRTLGGRVIDSHEPTGAVLSSHALVGSYTVGTRDGFVSAWNITPEVRFLGEISASSAPVKRVRIVSRDANHVDVIALADSPYMIRFAPNAAPEKLWVGGAPAATACPPAVQACDSPKAKRVPTQRPIAFSCAFKVQNLLALGAMDGTAWIYDINQRAPVAHLSLFSGKRCYVSSVLLVLRPGAAVLFASSNAAKMICAQFHTTRADDAVVLDSVDPQISFVLPSPGPRILEEIFEVDGGYMLLGFSGNKFKAYTLRIDNAVFPPSFLCCEIASRAAMGIATPFATNGMSCLLSVKGTTARFDIPPPPRLLRDGIPDVNCVAPAGPYVVAVREDNYVSLLNPTRPRTEQLFTPLLAHRSPVKSVCSVHAGDATLVFTGGSREELFCWELGDGFFSTIAQLPYKTEQVQARITAVAAHALPAGGCGASALLAAGYSSGTINLFHFDSVAKKFLLIASTTSAGVVRTVTFAHTSNALLLSACGTGGGLLVWDVTRAFELCQRFQATVGDAWRKEALIPLTTYRSGSPPRMADVPGFDAYGFELAAPRTFAGLHEGAINSLSVHSTHPFALLSGGDDHFTKLHTFRGPEGGLSLEQTTVVSEHTCSVRAVLSFKDELGRLLSASYAWDTRLVIAGSVSATRCLHVTKASSMCFHPTAGLVLAGEGVASYPLATLLADAE
eukprot:gnl/Chilomastix_cuspidata/2620.p1 GENE.gnl/Chilomastix_cuspidata/2620~~gnl/Chilomastix_cuspidata/2620.p1  ORF type:complete len:1029 (-),score=147.81 gnl/Chilomastix_cuspidata/2620:38-3124(-)